MQSQPRPGPKAARAAALGLLLALEVAACSSATGFEVDPQCVPTLTEAFESGLRAPLAQDTGARWTIPERMVTHHVPGVSVAIVRDGEVVFARGYGVAQAGSSECIDTNTVFSVASVSKVGAATVTLTLVDDGLVDLDQPVNAYLSRWSVPDNALTQQVPPTLRHIMSHTGGFSVHGFANYQPSEPVPGILDILDGRSPAKNPPIRVTQLPGSAFRYSGGGTTVEELAIEEVTGLSFETAAAERVLEPLGMTRTTYAQPLPASFGNIAKAHGPTGVPRALPRGWETMPEHAAAGLWTTPSDIGRLVIALIDSYHGEPGAILSQTVAQDMMTPVGPGSYGLGPELVLSPNGILFSHQGVNASYITQMHGLVYTRAGLVITTNGENGQAIIDEIVRAVWDAEGWPTS